MRVRKDYQAVLASINRMPLKVNEIAVAFESGRPISSFPAALHYARRQRFVRQDAAGLLMLTAPGRKALTSFRS